MYRMLVKEEERLAAGWSYEPQVHYEKNAAVAALEAATRKEAVKSTRATRTVRSCIPARVAEN